MTHDTQLPASPPGVGIDTGKLQSFATRLLGDMAGAMASLMCTIGDRLGLFRELRDGGPATSEQLAERTSLDERYLREWLRALASAGYLEHDPVGGRFTLPSEHAAALAGEGGPMFMGGAYQQLPGLLGPLDRVTRAFQDGRGVPLEAYGDDLRLGMERVSAGWFENLLVPRWLPALPGMPERLRRGATVADIGCGGGRALISMARAFPASRFVGYALLDTHVERARTNAGRAGVADRVRFETRDATDGLPETYDLITTFDVLHDVVDPLAILKTVHRALEPDGSFLLLEINAAEQLQDNAGPIGTMMYGTSVLFCLPTSLAAGAPGLGTMGLPEVTIRQLCSAAGFASPRRLPSENPFHALYQVDP